MDDASPVFCSLSRLVGPGHTRIGLLDVLSYACAGAFLVVSLIESRRKLCPLCPANSRPAPTLFGGSQFLECRPCPVRARSTFAVGRSARSPSLCARCFGESVSIVVGDRHPIGPSLRPPSTTRPRSGPPQTLQHHEEQRFLGAPQRLPGPQDILVGDSLPRRLPRNLRRPPPDCADPRLCRLPCPSILRDRRPGWLVARAQPQQKEEDDEGKAQSADRWFDQGNNSGLGRLWPAHARSPPQN